MTAAALAHVSSPEPSSGAVTAAEQAPATTVTPSNVSEAPQPQQVEGEAPAADPASPEAQATPSYIDLDDTAIVRVKVNGQVQELPWGEAKSQLMKSRHYTQEMQKLRANEAQWKQKLTVAEQAQSQREQLATMVSHPQMLAGWIQQSGLLPQVAQYLGLTQAQAMQAIQSAGQQQQPQAPAYDPAALVNMGDARQLFQTEAQQLQSALAGHVDARVQQALAQLGEVDQKIEQKLAALENAKEVSNFNQKIESTIASVLDSHKVLNNIPDINGLLRSEVAKLQPRTPDEMLEAFKIVSHGMVEGIEETYRASRTAAEAAKAKLAAQGIEPPKGQAATLRTQISYADNAGKFSWGKVEDAVRTALSRS